jgi:hypothetical protein
MMLTPKQIEELKEFNWQTIIDYGNSLQDFNEAQLRFLKGLIIEKTVEQHSNENLRYVGEDHRDYVWDNYKQDVELKSQLSTNMYNKNGTLRKTYEIKLNNSNGTNKNEVLPEDQVADCLIVVRNDGAFVIDKETVMRNAKYQGDGVVVKVPNSEVTEISGRISVKNKYNSNLKQLILEAIANDIPRI